MENFRDKIKGYKAIPNDNSWEHMLLKKEKRNFKKYKNFMFLLLGLNLVGLLYLSTNAWNSRVDLQQESKNNSNIELQKKNQTLRNTISNLKNRISVLSSKTSFSLDNKPSTSVTTTAQTIQTYKEQAKSTSSTGIKSETTSPYTSSLPTLLFDSNDTEKYLLELATQKTLVMPFVFKQAGSIDKASRKWYATLGSTYISLQGKQRSVVFGINRSLHKYLDVGVLVKLSNDQERSEFRNFSNIKDQQNETLGLVFLRANALNFNKLHFHFDAGFGYRFVNRLTRESRMVDNAIEYYNKGSKYSTFASQFAIGSRYDFTSRLSIGTRFFIDDIFHNETTLNYRF